MTYRDAVGAFGPLCQMSTLMLCLIRQEAVQARDKDFVEAIDAILRHRLRKLLP